MAKPTHKITDPAFNYRNAAQTDVRDTWRKFGWKPISEKPPQQQEPSARVLRMARGKA